MVESYRNEFRPSAQFPEPHAIMAISVLCAETEEKAAQLRKLLDFILLRFERGEFGPMPDYEEIKDYEFSPAEQERLHANSGRLISGTPAMVKAKLTRLADDFDVDEIIVSAMMDKQEDRVRSFELLAKRI